MISNIDKRDAERERQKERGREREAERERGERREEKIQGTRAVSAVNHAPCAAQSISSLYLQVSVSLIVSCHLQLGSCWSNFDSDF